jgi:hypothetical protein
MSSPEITQQEIFDAIQRVPTERWGEVLHAIEILQVSPASASSSKPVTTGTDLRDSELIGIWADRADMANSQEFARELRQQAEQRNRQG